MALLTLTRILYQKSPLISKVGITDLNTIITRCSSTSHISPSKVILTESPFKSSGSWLNRLQYKVGIGDVNIFALRRASIFHYEACTDKLDPTSYFKHFQLPDTLFAFFRVVQLHVWMCQARSMLEGPEGRTLRNEIMERMWQDLDTRLQRMEVYAFSQRKQILEDLLFHHQAAIFSYDEGLLSDDKTLANALWRTLYSKEVVDPVILEDTVKYVRAQMDHLRSIGPRDWCLDGRITWVPYPPLINNRDLTKRVGK